VGSMMLNPPPCTNAARCSMTLPSTTSDQCVSTILLFGQSIHYRTKQVKQNFS
jgi:hypothetical protein